MSVAVKLFAADPSIAIDVSDGLNRIVEILILFGAGGINRAHNLEHTRIDAARFV